MRSTITGKAVTTLAAICTIAALTPAAAAAAPPAIATPAPATAIVLQRSGGIAGIQDTLKVDRATTGGRPSLRMAASPEFRRLRGSYLPANPCCDRFLYSVTVTYRDGHHKTVSTVDGTPEPRILWNLIAEIQRVGVRQPSPTTAPTPTAA